MTKKLSQNDLKNVSGGNEFPGFDEPIVISEDLKKIQENYLIINKLPNVNAIEIEKSIEEAMNLANNQNIEGFYLKINELKAYLNNLKISQPNHEEELNNILKKLEELQNKYFK